MKLIIDIPDNDYRHIKEYYEKNDIVEATYSYIYHGIPLPKGHGRLIDADELLKRIDKVAKKSSLSIDTINGLCGAVAIIYDMLIETGQEKVDDYRDRLDELEREEYYESKYGKEQE